MSLETLTARAALLVLLPSVLFAGPVAAPRSGYGIDDLQVVTIPFTRFQPWTSASGPVDIRSVISPSGGYRYLMGGAAILVAEIDAGLVPNGAALESVVFYVRDAESGANREFRGSLWRSWTDSDGSDPGSDEPLTVQTTGTPDDTAIGGDPGIDVRYQYDVDGDQVDEVVSYFLTAEFGFSGQSVFGATMQLRQVRLLFRRQVLPAPSMATFDDVPTGHQFFQFVEALAASGITVGCGSDDYCPDDPVTRGQMAVFLSKALGLHWPGPPVP